MRKTFFISAILACNLAIHPLYAEIKLPAIFSSNMVLQRNADVNLWGWAKPGEEINIDVSWTNKSFSIKADVDGKWRFSLQTTNSKQAQTISIKDDDSIVKLENILFGEVWLCSGQSNMEQPVKGYYGEPTFGSQQAILHSKNPNLRLFTVHKSGSKTPLEDIKNYSGWHEASPESVSNFSAVAYFFGQQLQEILDCPVGLIHTSYGSSSVRAWMSMSELSKIETVDLDDYDINEDTFLVPTALFNAMIKPLMPYTIKGALWYQGETNRFEPQQYKKLFPAMVNDWRKRWDIGDFPFFFVQIAPFRYWEDPDNKAFQTYCNSAFMREAQVECKELIPNSGIAITLDVGDYRCVHPPKKKEVAERLLLQALNKTYKYKIEGESPTLESVEKKDQGLVVKFKNNNSGLYAHQSEIDGFEIAGNDRIFYKAKAKIIKYGEVFVESENVTSPVAVRYAWRNWVQGTLFGGNMLPVSSFRTDRWDEATLSKD